MKISVFAMAKYSSNIHCKTIALELCFRDSSNLQLYKTNSLEKDTYRPERFLCKHHAKNERYMIRL
jgi:hypothetical protein